ncbi:alpha/beta hydrolase family protein [Amphritea sp. HPY]|uniref:alpha/beta hydrolase family protein n=1 Tax=Amphritea sp. HPY TaxID=3421652 RepID=UPI003D7CEB93
MLHLRYITIILALLFMTGCNESTITHAEQRLTHQTGILLKDESRQRIIDVQLWHPSQLSQTSSMPFLIFAHGLGGLPKEGTWLANYMAERGYVVAALKFPFTNRDDLDAIDRNDLPNQPGDVSLVIDAALGQVAGIDKAVVDAINPERIALAGHSFGGLTTYLTVYDRHLSDSRVKAAVLMAAAGGDFLTPDFYANSPVPMLLLHGTHDLLVDYRSTSVNAFAQSTAPKILVEYSGGTHLGYSGRSSYFFNPDNLPCWLAGALFEKDEGESFYDILKQSDPDRGIGPYSAPMPCTFAVPDSDFMAIERQRFLSEQIIAMFLDSLLTAPEAITQNKTRLKDLLAQFDAEQQDIEILNDL